MSQGHEQVMAAGKIGGQARAMASRAASSGHPLPPRLQGVSRRAQEPLSADRRAFGEHDYGGSKVGGTSLNGFSSGDTRMQHLLEDDTQVYKQFVENDSFLPFVGDMVCTLTGKG